MRVDGSKPVVAPVAESKDTAPVVHPVTREAPEARPVAVPSNPGVTLPAPGASGFMRGRAPLVIAHRGGGLEAPENTLAAFRNAVRVHADWSELDVALSRDGKVIVIHDETLERTTNGHGRVDATSFAELRALDAGRGEKLPTLEEALAVPGTKLVVEMKHSSRPDALADATVKAIQASGMQSRVVLGSFEPGLLAAAHAVDPSIPLLGFVGDEAGLTAMAKLPLSVLAVSGNVVDAALKARAPGQAVWAWTIESPDEARRLRDAGVDGIITDAPSAVIPAVR